MISGLVNCANPWANVSHVLLAAGQTYNAFGVAAADTVKGSVGDKVILKVVINIIDVNKTIANIIVGFINTPLLMVCDDIIS